jgi:hypothetical protein
MVLRRLCGEEELMNLFSRTALLESMGKVARIGWHKLSVVKTYSAGKG